METLNTSTTKSYPKWALPLIAVLFLISGCSINGIDKQDQEITEEDLQAASEILGESLSDETSGVMGSLNDALTGISSDGFVRVSSPKSVVDDDDEDNSGRGRESNFSYSYDPQTGTHTLSFMRTVDKPNFAKSVIDTLKYIFTAENGDFIVFPRANRERIETIDYKGFREGTLNSLNRNSFFVRKDTFLIDGVSDASNILFIDGVHNGEGNFEGTTDDGNTLKRDYTLEVNFLNLEIDKSMVKQNQNLQEGVTGTLTYELIVEKTRNGSSSTKTIRGTIEMNGDGTALLRFERFSKLFQINLNDGDVRDQDDEFEGKVRSVDLERNTFTLTNGRIIRMTSETEIENEGDLFSLQEVTNALENGLYVEAEGEGFIDGDVFVATEVEFETEDDGSDGDASFEAFISDVNLEDNTVILQDERVILLTEDTLIDEEGDFTDLASVKDALEQGKTVEADGDGFYSDQESITLVATEIEFDLEDSDDDGDNNDDDGNN